MEIANMPSAKATSSIRLIRSSTPGSDGGSTGPRAAIRPCSLSLELQRRPPDATCRDYAPKAPIGWHFSRPGAAARKTMEGHSRWAFPAIALTKKAHRAPTASRPRAAAHLTGAWAPVTSGRSQYLAIIRPGVPGMGNTARSGDTGSLPDYPQLLGHPRPLWMLFMSEFWERFAFYGMRWALTLYIVAQFYNGDVAGQADASPTYGAYLALVYATAVFGGYVADKILGYQRSILLGAVVMAAGLFMIMLPSHEVFMLGLATIIVGNGLFKPNISSMVGQLYAPGDSRRDRGFTLFYMGINAGALIAPVLTSILANKVFGTPGHHSYNVVFAASGVGMLISLVWFWFGRRQLGPVGRPSPEMANPMRVVYVAIGVLVAIPLVYLLMDRAGAVVLQWLLDRKSTRLNSSHPSISYAVFCLKKKKIIKIS